MASSAEQIRAYRGPALFSYGFRPFFLLGAAWAAVTMALFIPLLSGQLTLPTSLGASQWHAHELLYGYVPAVVAGFLLTAVPNWTGRLPVVGAPLMVLVSVWALGRIAVLTSSLIGASAAAILDLGFLAILGVIVAREIFAGRDKRNLKVLTVLLLLLSGNATFHAEAIWGRSEGYGERIGIASAILLIMLIGGRIIPSFTRNWLAKRGPGALPNPFDRFDVAAMIAGGTALTAWVVSPHAAPTGWLALLAMTVHTGRLVRWAGYRAMSEPLVLVLHVAYAFIPAGFGLAALSIFQPDAVPITGALHGWTAGAIGLMTLAVMTRASLGHTGQPLKATPPITAVCAACLLTALCRIAAGFGIVREPMLYLSAASWIAAFAGFVIVYAPLLARRHP